jgi:hypothetical protein
MFDNKQYSRIKSSIPKEIKIVGVTKNKTSQDIIAAINSGIKIIGENYIQEAEIKYQEMKEVLKNKSAEFHLIGHLQTNKINEAVKIFDCIQTVDSIKKAEKINEACKKIEKQINVMIQINSGEEQKSGIKKEELITLINKIKELKNLRLIGLMTIPKPNDETAFQEMNLLKNKFKLRELSMGMSKDYNQAIKEGSTMIRLGTILFGER